MNMASEESRQRFPAAELRRFTAAVLEHFAMPADDAAIAAEVLVDADLQGIESHGIAHLVPHHSYVPGIERGSVNTQPTYTVLRESPTTAAWDADRAFGLVVGYRAMEAAIAKAQASGIGMVTVRNSRHFGAAGYYARMAAERGLVGMAMCNVHPLAVAAGGREKVVGTNPIAMSAPVKDDHPFLLDIATTAVAGGKLEIANRQGKRIPPGWALDADGSESDDPLALRKEGALLPLGSRAETSAHKGYGLGLMVDILCGPLSGAGSGLFVDKSVGEMGQWFSAWRIDAFRDPDEFAEDMKRMVDHLRATEPAPGVDAVLVPGDPEATMRADREALGIPLEDQTVRELQELGDKIGAIPPTPA